MERREFVLVHIAGIQCLVWSKQSTWDDMAGVENVGLMGCVLLGYGVDNARIDMIARSRPF